eukprot:jgi/Galph1/2740/GphlegSOOS_G1395.1
MESTCFSIFNLLIIVEGIPKEQGILSYWRGNGVNLWRTIPGSALKLFLYEKFKSQIFLQKDRNYDGFELILRKVGSGVLAGVATLLIFYPLDLTRTRFAADVSHRGMLREYVSVADCLKKIVQREGYQGLYSGASVSLCGIVPYIATAFITYDLLKTLLPEEDKIWFYLHLPKVMLSASTGVIAQSLTYPLDTIRRRMQMNSRSGLKRYRSVFHCIASMWKTEGFRSFYRGITMNMLRTIPGVTIQLYCYDLFQSYLRRVTYSSKS